MSRFQKLLRTIKFMVEPWHPPKRPTFLTDGELEARIKVARDLVGDRQPVADRKYLEDQPDYPEYHGPIG